jgi:hypothetical protein
MKFAGSIAFALLPAFLGKVCADQAAVDETGAKVFAIDTANSDASTKTLIDIEVVNVYQEAVIIHKNIRGEMVPPSSHEDSFSTYATDGDFSSQEESFTLSAVGVDGVSKASKSYQSKAAGKSSKSVMTSTTSTTSTTATCKGRLESCSPLNTNECCSDYVCSCGGPVCACAS